MRTFLNTYTKQLHDMEETLDQQHTRVWSASDMLGLSVEPHEETALPDLVSTDNKPLSSVLMVISALCIEVDEHKRMVADRFYAPLTIFGDCPALMKEDGSLRPGDEEMQLARMLPVFMDLYNFTSRLNGLCINLVHQLAALYDTNQKIYRSTFCHVHLRSAFEALATLLTMLATLDEVISNNNRLSEFHLLQYRRMVRNMKSDPSKYGVEEEKLRTLEVRLQNLDEKLLTGVLLENCIMQEFDVPNLLNVSNNKTFLEELLHHIQQFLTNVAETLDSSTETNQRTQLIGTLCLYHLYRRLTVTQKPPKKLFTNLWAVCKSCPLIHVHGPVLMHTMTFLLSHSDEKVPLVKVKKDELENTAKAYIDSLTQNLAKQVHSLYLQVCTWMIRLESGTEPHLDKKDILARRLTLMVNGILLAHHISRLLRTCLMGHLEYKLPMSRQTVQLLATCAEMLKGIETSFHHKSAMAGESIVHMCRQLSYSLQHVFLRAQKKLEQKTSATRQPTDEHMDQLAGLTLVLRMLNGPTTNTRQIIFALAMAVSQPKNILKEKEAEDVRLILWKFALLSEWQSSLRACCDTSCLYWARTTLPTALQAVYNNAEVAQKLPYIMAAFAEGVIAARRCVASTDLGEWYEKEVATIFQDNIVFPLCREVETDLRLSIHAAVDSVERRNPFKHRVREIQTFLNLRRFRLFSERIDVRERVVHYLDTTFYNLTALTPHDWKTYGEMRNLAQEKFGLQLTGVYLPGATLEQGLDVLVIMRNIHVFVSKYHYNLNNQIFVEKIGENKHVHTINIRHVANSIRTHGTGIINTTVNYTYQFLIQKLFIFSQFLFDDHIKSPCMKSYKFFKDNREQLNNQYPFDRADNFNRHIRKLGVTEDGLTFLDQFRVLITEIGNAMGYVRMVRSGGQHYCSNAIKFVPDLQSIADFPSMVEKSGLATETLGAAKNLTAIIHSLMDNFAEGTDFFKALVDVFREELNNEKNSHLRYFHIIVPPLIINFLEHMINSKDTLAKRSKEGCFTDDGFAMGLAYLLQIVNQSEKFDSLHWFDSLRDHVVDLKKQSEIQEELARQREKKLKAGRKEMPAPASQASVMNLSAKRIEAMELEVELFYYSFRGARIFFAS
eukprot:c9221_g1_i1.p1 GENE.c9221_g1_i1~~c9221_g1_i1.p1  ORF type:complete len:1167 (-),score=295.14 c9221_g1_i1:59-3418(-)